MKRTKSHNVGVNKKYCINKLFQKAMGVPLEQYRKANEYRESMGKQRTLSMSSPKNLVSTPMQSDIRSNSVAQALRQSKSG